MLYTKAYNCVNGNTKTHSYRSFKAFATPEELEEERSRLQKKFKVDTVDFVKILDTGSLILSEEEVKEIFEKQDELAT